MVIVESPEHMRNAEFPIAVTLLGMVIEFKPVQFINALSQM